MATSRQPVADRKIREVSLTTSRARRLRRDQTIAESMLWEKLRAGRLNGLRFRRQFPIGKYIADFCCNDTQLVVELDGGQHAQTAGVLHDATRTRRIEQYGYRVIRFWDNEVLTNMDGVLDAIIREASSV